MEHRKSPKASADTNGQDAIAIELLPTAPAPPSPYLTADEAGKYLRVFNTAHAMQQATKRYGIPHIRLGKHILYLPSQLDEFMTVATEATGALRPRRRRRRRG